MSGPPRDSSNTNAAVDNILVAKKIVAQTLIAGSVSMSVLDVAGDASVGGSLDVAGDAGVGGSLEVTGDVTIDGKLVVATQDIAAGLSRLFDNFVIVDDAFNGVTLPLTAAQVNGEVPRAGWVPYFGSESVVTLLGPFMDAHLHSNAPGSTQAFGVDSSAGNGFNTSCGELQVAFEGGLQIDPVLRNISTFVTATSIVFLSHQAPTVSGTFTASDGSTMMYVNAQVLVYVADTGSSSPPVPPGPPGGTAGVDYLQVAVVTSNAVYKFQEVSPGVPTVPLVHWLNTNIFYFDAGLPGGLSNTSRGVITLVPMALNLVVTSMPAGSISGADPIVLLTRKVPGGGLGNLSVPTIVLDAAGVLGNFSVASDSATESSTVMWQVIQSD